MSWKVKEEPTPYTAERLLLGFATCGLSEALTRDTYLVENEDTGIVAEVQASDCLELGEKIARGDFVKDV